MVITMAVATVERLRDCEEGQPVMQLSGVVVNLLLLCLVPGWSPGWFQFLDFSNWKISNAELHHDWAMA